MLKEVVIPLEDKDFSERPALKSGLSCNGKMFCTTGPDYLFGVKFRKALEGLVLKNILDFRWCFKQNGEFWAVLEEWCETASDEESPHLRCRPGDEMTGFDPIMILAKQSWWWVQRAVLQREGRRGSPSLPEHQQWLKENFGFPDQLVVECDLRLV